MNLKSDLLGDSQAP